MKARTHGRFACVVAAALLLAPAAWAEAELESDLDAAPSEENAIEEPENAAPEAQAAPATGSVARATFTTDVLDREPQDSVSTLQNDHLQVFYFSELRGLQGRRVTHRWEYNGALMAEVPFEVGAPRWRVYSTKTLDESWLGEWSVTIVDDTGRELRRDTLRYTEVVEEPAEEAADEQPAEESEALPAAPRP